MAVTAESDSKFDIYTDNAFKLFKGCPQSKEEFKYWTDICEKWQERERFDIYIQKVIKKWNDVLDGRCDNDDAYSSESEWKYDMMNETCVRLWDHMNSSEDYNPSDKSCVIHIEVTRRGLRWDEDQYFGLSNFPEFDKLKIGIFVEGVFDKIIITNDVITIPIAISGNSDVDHTMLLIVDQKRKYWSIFDCNGITEIYDKESIYDDESVLCLSQKNFPSVFEILGNVVSRVCGTELPYLPTYGRDIHYNPLEGDGCCTAWSLLIAIISSNDILSNMEVFSDTSIHQENAFLQCINQLSERRIRELINLVISEYPSCVAP